MTLRIRPTIAAEELPLVGGDVNEIEVFEEVLPLSLAVEQVIDETRHFLVHRRAEPQLNHNVTFRRNSQQNMTYNSNTKKLVMFNMIG